MSQHKADQWSSKAGVIFAVAGSAVGLGNFLRFPGLAAQYGGGAFMVAYLISLLLLGLPVAWAEWSLGRRGGDLGSNTAPGIYWRLTKGSKWWKMLGVLSVLGPTAVAFYYIVVEAWCFGYTWKLLSGTESFSSAVETGKIFSEFVGMSSNGSAFHSSSVLVVCLALSILLNLGIIYRGIGKGVEVFCRWVVPFLLLISVILLVKVLTLGTPDETHPERNVQEGLGYMWNPNKTLVEARETVDGKATWTVRTMLPANDPTRRAQLIDEVMNSGGTMRLTHISLWEGLKNIELWLAAAGQVFLSLSVGTGLILTYSSYLRKNDDIALSAVTAASCNETCEVGLAGMMTIPAAVAFLGVAGAAGQSTFALGFIALPQVFARMAAGGLFGSLFFILLSLAAVTSSISMMQVGLAFFEEFMGLKRRMAVVILGFFTCMGALVVTWFSHNLAALDSYDFWIGTMCFFVSAMVMMILFSWKLNINEGIADINSTSDISIPHIYRFILKFVTPTLLVLLLASWLFRNIWVAPAAPVRSLMDGELGAVIPVFLLGTYAVFLICVTMASSRHQSWPPAKKKSGQS